MQASRQARSSCLTHGRVDANALSETNVALMA
jgi:hypothetical protein